MTARTLALDDLARDAAVGLGLVALVTTAVRAVAPVLSPADIVMGYLLAVLLAAFRRGRLAAILTSALSVGAYNFFFVAPFHTFAVSDSRNLLTFAGLFGVGLAAATLAERLRRQEADAIAREARTAALLALTRAIATAATEADVARATVTEAAAHLAAGAAVLVPAGESGWTWLARAGRSDDDDAEATLAQGALAAGAPARDAAHLALPVTARGERLAVLVLREPAPAATDLADAFTRQAGLAIARIQQAAVAEEATLRARAEELRSALLSTVSHDLRTPLAAITGAATALLDDRGLLSPVARAELLAAVRDEAARLERLVANLLEMTRLASGPLVLRREWVPLDELVGAAFSRVEGPLAGHPASVHLDADLPMVEVDPVVFEHVLVNLLENAARHTPPGTAVELSARRAAGGVEIEVRDRGAGLPPGDPARLFDAFVRGAPANVPGSGLGLALCRGIVEAHGGTIAARTAEGGGAAFVVTLPPRGPPPAVPPEEDP